MASVIKIEIRLSAELGDKLAFLERLLLPNG